MSEFPEGAEAPPALTRRELLTLLGANAALASATGCSRGTAEGIAPYVRQPPEVTPGVPSRYATTMSLGGYGIGMIVESHEGRPTKAEGNPLHPASLGALGTFEQASVLSMYDPARVRALTRYGAPSTWAALLEEVGAAPAVGKRIHFLLEPTSSPHVAPLVDRLRRKGMVVHYDAPLSRENAWAGARLAFGKVLEARWDFSRADVVLALDADFLAAAGIADGLGARVGRQAQDGGAGRPAQPALRRRAQADDDRDVRRRAPRGAGARGEQRRGRRPRRPGGAGRSGGAGPGGSCPGLANPGSP